MTYVIPQFLLDNKIIIKNGTINKNIKKMLRNRPELLDKIVQLTLFIDRLDEDTYVERIHAIIHNISAIPKCSTCNTNNVTFEKGAHKYQTYCSIKCAANSETKKQQIKNTNNDKFGGNAPMSCEYVKQKSRNTSTTKYGVKYHQLSTEGKHARQLTNQQRYLSNSPFGNTDIQDKIKQTNISKYGSNNYQRSLKTSISQSLLDDKDWLYEQHIVNQLTLYQIADTLQVSSFCVRSYFDKHNIPISKFAMSVGHKSIISTIQTIPNIEVITNDRKLIAPLELDVVLPQYNIAIEFNGVYWHSEGRGKSRQYHNNKTLQCNKVGYKLIQCWDVEYNNKPDIVNSRLLAMIGHSTRIYARQCQIIELSKEQSKQFFEHNHIQGSVSNTVCIGLLHNEIIVAAMSFGKPRFNNQYQWELLRYCNVLNHTIVGGASKCLSYFCNTFNPLNIISYSDRRWSQGNLYSKLNFTYIHTSNPNYYYFNISDSTKLLHRINFQKAKLAKKLDIFDPLLSEWDNMRNNNYDRVWDCGNDVWVWNKSAF